MARSRGGAGRVRIVAGEFGGRFIKSPSGLGTRPTMAQVREAVFSILGPMDGLRCADLFAGTGAYGLEALSRGAASVEAFENDRTVLQILRANAASLLGDSATTRHHVTVGRLPGALKRAQATPYDLVFADPPWGQGLGPKVAAVLTQGEASLVTADTRLVLEESMLAPAVDWAAAGWKVTDERRYGEAAITLLARL